MTQKTDGPERIYLNLGNEETTYQEALAGGAEITWCEDSQDEWDIEYIRADLYYNLEGRADGFLDSLMLANTELKDLHADNAWLKREAALLRKENAVLRGLVADNMESNNDFLTDWDIKAREILDDDTKNPST